MSLLKDKFLFDVFKVNLNQLVALNNKYGWSLNLEELKIIVQYFRNISRNPTRAEIETIAQTWSEHCKHKTFNSPCVLTIKDHRGKIKNIYRFKNLFKETIVYATEKLKKSYCLSVFKDNAGVIELGKESKWGICFKVETHNHPCAIEPYGGTETGVGGVVRDILGVGLGAKPILNTDNFCFAFPDKKYNVAKGFLSPHKIISGVVSGVRDYGNKIGIPTACGSVFFDDRYLYNPLVYVGCVGIINRKDVNKEVLPGSYIVVIGGSTGKDGVGGSTFSSQDISENSTSSHVQIGHAINEKKVIDVLMKAKELSIYSALTDCGAGGFSSAVGELASETGALVDLDKVILKDRDIEGWQVWLSESQERMVLCVYEDKIKELEKLCEVEECQMYIIGRFTNDRKLTVKWKGENIVELDMDFLHQGLPKIERKAIWIEPKMKNKISKISVMDYYDRFEKIISDLNVTSRRWIIQQYDHEVIGQTVLKPFCGVNEYAPSDATVIWTGQVCEDFSLFNGFAVACGMKPNMSDISPYEMAKYSFDEAIRNLVCVGADISRGAALDNFCAANPNNEKVMGEFSLAAIGARDASVDMEIPYISGKDSFYNQTNIGSKIYKIPTTLLISAIAPVEDVRNIITPYFKKPFNPIYIVGSFGKGFGASVYGRLFQNDNNYISPLNLKQNRKVYLKLLEAMRKGFVISAHDVSEGGLAACVFEMSLCFIGADININEIIKVYNITELEVLFGECGSKIVVEIDLKNEKEFIKLMKNFPVIKIGYTTKIPSIVFKDNGNILFTSDVNKARQLWERNVL
ncbi:MAG: phosphoribosylformylglycinamidine synthase subunit PurL [Elusimicrobiales bacterium]|nr:phosphoribosylformylglycinamidine synthase subunit PurL [Elusimicrobiales bacterium]